MSRPIRFSIVVIMAVMMFALARTSVGHAATQGTLNVWCDIRGAKPADEASCYVAIDNMLQSDTIAPGKKVAYKLAPGDHQIAVSIAGPAPGAWSPELGITKTVKISAGYTRSLYATFLRRGYITLALNQPNAVADFYVDGQLKQSQVASLQMYMTPAKWYAVEARNITDPTLTGDYRWKDTKVNTYVPAGSTKTVRFSLQKQSSKGFLKLTCRIQNAPANEPLFCQPKIDGIAVEPIPQNGTVTYTLAPGEHYVESTAGPQGNWTVPQLGFANATITAGATVKRTLTVYLYVCTIEWFFGPPAGLCAKAPEGTSEATIQYFEHGLMLWSKASGIYTVMPDADARHVLTFRDPLNPQRDSSGEVGAPPPGLFAPINGFGSIWRGDVYTPLVIPLRDKLGWATTQEIVYQSTGQCGTNNPYRPFSVCFFTLPDGRLLSITQTGTSGAFWSFYN